MKLPTLLLSAACLLYPAVSAVAADPAPAAPPSTAQPLEAYAAMGTSFVLDNRLAQLGWSPSQIEAFLEGVRSGFRGAPRPPDAVMQGLFDEIGRQVQQLKEEEKRRRFGAAAFTRPGYLQAYLKQMRTRFELQSSDSGMCFGMKNAGFGARPEPEDTVIISYKVTAADAESDLPSIGGERLKVKVQDLVPGMTEALQMMTVGTVGMLVLPPDLSYGTGAWPPGAERGTPLIFTVVLHEIVNPAAAP